MEVTVVINSRGAAPLGRSDRADVDMDHARLDDPGVRSGERWQAPVTAPNHMLGNRAKRATRIWQDPVGFEAGDVNVYRYVGNIVLNSVDPSGLAPNLSVEDLTLEDATEVALKNAEFKVDGINVQVKAFTNGKGKIKSFAGELEITKGGITLAAIFDCDVDASREFHWMQLSRRVATAAPGKTLPSMYGVPKRKIGGETFMVYAPLGEWHIDSVNETEVYYDGLGAPATRGTIGKTTALIMHDNPGALKLSEAIAEKFEAKTYLVYKGKIVYSVYWNKSATLKSGTWEESGVTVSDSGQGLLGDLPLNPTKGKWPWYFKKPDDKEPVLLPNPIVVPK